MTRPLPPPGRNAGSSFLSEEDARAILHRAVQLQTEAAERLERQAQLRMLTQSSTGDTDTGYRREDIEAAAAEAGIGVEHIRQAMLEQETLGDTAAPLAPWVDRMGVRLLRTRKRSLELVRAVRADPTAVVSTFRTVAASPPYNLKLIDSIGDSPLDGAVSVYRLPEYSSMSWNPDPLGYVAALIGLKQVLVTFRLHVPPDAPGCTIELRGDLRGGTRSNVWAGLSVSGVGGVGLGAAALGVAAAAGLALPVVAAASAVGLLGGGGASAVGYGAAYRYYLRKMTEEMDTMLRVVDVTARTNPG